MYPPNNAVVLTLMSSDASLLSAGVRLCLTIANEKKKKKKKKKIFYNSTHAKDLLRQNTRAFGVLKTCQKKHANKRTGHE